MNNSRRVAITGLGVISPLGNTDEALWQALSTGQSGVRPIRWLSNDHFPTTFAGEAVDFSGAIDDFGPLEAEVKKALRKGLKVMCRESQMGVAAAQRALASAGLSAQPLDPERIGVVFGADYMLTLPEDFAAGVSQCTDPNGKFDFTRWATEGMPRLTPLWLLKYLPNMPASHVAIYNDLRGPNNSLTLREASSNAAVGEAYRTILRGSAEIMIAGATGTRVHPMKMVHSVTQEEVAGNGHDPQSASRPFDLHRHGMVLGEGAGAIVLEELSSAQARGAKIYGEIIGTASSSVAVRNGAGGRKQALANVLAATLREAGLKPQEVGHVHAHGLSTQSCDQEEAQAIQEVFGDAASRLPVTAAKSYFGNLGAGSGMVELIASLLALQHRQLFPVLNYDTPDANCALAVCREPGSPGTSFLNANVTPQGQATAVMVRSLA